ncbi:OmpA family protein [Pelagibaculum spongiae]|uniref:OmpA-like domain-containing protein n=1 Tax=Pelagibaculum spongiae TaxID=2080658 RepID=A0A2V1H3I9_9GAMM|nr:OmpA family protein [Pelagibaculum spongiae]PVZ71788.1 hypothetical protein DC094_01815 [Pelagibaculum spongiae]
MKHSIRTISLALVIAIGVAGCATTNPYSGEQKTSNATKGAGLGAVAGALLGAAISSKKDRKKGALQGALLGAGIGGGVGYRMDVQEAELRKRLENTGVRVSRDGDSIRLVMPGHITFAVNRSNVQSDFYPILSSVAEVLVEFKETSIQVEGYTDSSGSDSHNQQLSENRAQSVASFMNQQGIDRRRMHITGYGERFPIASNNKKTGRMQNRRVEIKVIPPQKS